MSIVRRTQELQRRCNEWVKSHAGSASAASTASPLTHESTHVLPPNPGPSIVMASPVSPGRHPPLHSNVLEWLIGEISAYEACFAQMPEKVFISRNEYEALAENYSSLGFQKPNRANSEVFGGYIMGVEIAIVEVLTARFWDPRYGDKP